ncbi:MAG: ribonuclease P protein component [Lautropia sp.]
MVISVAKRLVPSAVRRNTVKRIVREAWRASRQARPATDASGAGAPAAGSGKLGSERGLLMRLKAFPGRGKRLPPGRRPGPDAVAANEGRSAMRRSKNVSGHSSTIGQTPSEPSLAIVKRLLRADADRLFGEALRSPRHSPGGRRTARPVP